MIKIVKIIISLAVIIIFILPLVNFAKRVSRNNLAILDLSVQTAGQKASNDPGVVNLTLSLTELAKHNNSADCWLLINGSIYDVTSYVGFHPGGSAMLPYCGQEATAGYNTKGGQGAAHSQTAIDSLKNFFIGKLGESGILNAVNHPPVPPADLKKFDDESEDD